MYVRRQSGTWNPWWSTITFLSFKSCKQDEQQQKIELKTFKFALLEPEGS